jgi:hypothetical protein
MKTPLKIAFFWLALILAYIGCMLAFPHRVTVTSGLINRFILTLLFCISLFLIRNEPIRKNKFVFFNFLLYFGMSLMWFVYDFVGKAIFLESKYASFLYFQYLSIAYTFAASLAVLYLVIDFLFTDFKVSQKYALSLGIVTIFFAVVFFPFFKEPLSSYLSEDIKQWKTLSTYVQEKGEIPTTLEIASGVTLNVWSEGKEVGALNPEANLARIEELTPYLEGDNWNVLLMKPLYQKIIYVNVLIVGFVLLFFGYQFKKDPPQAAYIDKIMFLILMISSMDILHNWGYIKSVEWGSMTELFSAGQYITVFAELMMVLFFSLRLKFITSATGEYYERELEQNPKQVSRWRDWVDNIVIANFFNWKAINGRLFQKPSGR